MNERMNDEVGTFLSPRHRVSATAEKQHALPASQKHSQSKAERIPNCLDGLAACNALLAAGAASSEIAENVLPTIIAKPEQRIAKEGKSREQARNKQDVPPLPSAEQVSQMSPPFSSSSPPVFSFVHANSSLLRSFLHFTHPRSPSPSPPHQPPSTPATPPPSQPHSP